MNKEIEIPEGYEARIEGNKVIFVQKESEDERIREGIEKIVSSFDSLYLQENFFLSQKDALTWLEKQKEQKPVKLNYDTEVGLDRALQIIKAAKGNLYGYQTDDGIYECCHAIQTLECILENGIEQKPAECIEDSVKFEEGFKTGRESGLRDGQKYVLDNAESYGLYRLAEWSEEDKLMHDVVLNTLERVGDYGTIGMQKDWFKSLPERFNLQPKTEWSEEDEKALNSVLSSGKTVLTESNRKWLKSLRPQPHWKPSEEQLDALLASYSDEGVYDYDVLKSLYNDLKKL